MKVLVITPVKHINGVIGKLETIGCVTYLDDPLPSDLIQIIDQYDAIFTNPNKSKIFLGKDILSKARNLKVISTASTGTNHIDLNYTGENNIKILALTEERSAINLITSTAEHAFALTLSSLRNVVLSSKDVFDGNWNYEKFVGRQVNCLTFGVVGFGRLGSFYASYCHAFGAKVLVYDPYKTITSDNYVQVGNVTNLLEAADVISLHVHVNPETLHMVNSSWFSSMKSNVLLINTSRGEIINEADLVQFLISNRSARVATDVLTNEIRDFQNSSLYQFAKPHSDQVLITPHIGGMTKEAQEIAYNHAALQLCNYLSN
tara:strand:+ start:13 stop:966 length:954 start_codon:yes stop_codon:yes gene_type:complete